MNLKENALAILHHEQPDLYFDFMDAMTFVPDPILGRDLPPQDGEKHLDSWGTCQVWLPGSPGSHPAITDENKVIKDIEDWEDELVVPSNEELDWSAAKAVADSVDRDERFVGFFSAAGLFERSHFLMGMEDALCNYMLYPDEMIDLLTVIKDYKLDCIQRAYREVQPDVVFFQDDWGHKQAMFLPPDVWRKIIKPLQMEISDCIHDCGMLYVHHADCICEDICEDMVDLNIDIWQGVIPQNDIVSIQQRTNSKLAMIGGVDGPLLDDEEMSEEDIRSKVREELDAYLPAGRFFPGIPNGQCFHERNDAIVKDELLKYGRQWALDHPVGTAVEGSMPYDEEYFRDAIVGKAIVPRADD